MRRVWLALAGIGLACVAVAGLGARTAWARGGAAAPPPPPPPEWRGARPRAPIPPPRPPSRGLVPVPDVRGLAQEAAVRAIYAAGLTLGGVERASIDALEAELGRRYGPGLVVQQEPRPSVGEDPSWLPRDGAVWLRMSEGTPAVDAPAPAPPAPAPPPPGPGEAVPMPPYVAPPVVPDPGRPRPPPPPQWPGVEGPVAPAPAPAPVPVPVPGPATVPYCPPATEPLDAAPLAPNPALLGRIAPRKRLACERGRGEWHFRARGGWAWWLGADSGQDGAIAGADIGYTFPDCFGVDFFYRYASTRFDRSMGGITFQDGGDIHFIGAKATYEAAVSRGSAWFFYGGLGAGWFTTARFTNDDSGFGILGDVGLGYLIDRSARVRLGVNVHALLTSAGRDNPANDNTRRWLTAVAPTLGIEIDF